jgi:hypothetical protein
MNDDDNDVRWWVDDNDVRWCVDDNEYDIVQASKHGTGDIHI